VRQSDLFSFAEGRGRSPPSRDCPEESEDCPAPAIPGRGRKCAKCGRPLNGGGLDLLGWGLVCWNCYHQGGRRDGRGDMSSDATGSRNSGYNLRR
jgi:hypothetical protein